MDPLEFNDEELELIGSSVAMRMCYLETGTVSMSWDDAQRLGSDNWKQFGIRAPTRDQLSEAGRFRKIWLRILQRKFR